MSKKRKEEKNIQPNFEAELVTDEASGLKSTDTYEAKIKALEQEIESLNDILLRRSADLENVRKRAVRERLQWIEEAKMKAFEAFLPVNDDLIRTLEAAENQEIPRKFLDGVQMVAEKFERILTAQGVDSINETGIPFDVNIHDAMLRQPTPDTPPNTVIQVLETGYRMGSRVIRHAKVIVTE